MATSNLEVDARSDAYVWGDSVGDRGLTLLKSYLSCVLLESRELLKSCLDIVLIPQSSIQ